MGRGIFLIAAILALTGCVSAALPTTPVPNIYVMRHLNTPEGVTDPDLAPEGRAAAEALATWLAPDPPSAIFVSDTKRARQTAAPTAVRFGVAPTVYNPRDTPGLLSSILAHQGTFLIVGHSNTVPEIIAGLGGEKPAPLFHLDFGDIWRIHGAARTTSRAKLPQR